MHHRLPRGAKGLPWVLSGFCLLVETIHFFLFDLKKDVVSFFSLMLLELFVKWVFSSYKTRSRYIYFQFGESLIFLS